MGAKRNKTPKTAKPKPRKTKKEKATGDEVRGGRKKVEARKRTRRPADVGPGKKHRNVLGDDTKKALRKRHNEMMAKGGPAAKALDGVAKAREVGSRRAVAVGLMKVCKAIDALATSEDGPYAKEISGLRKVGVSIRKQCAEN